MQKLLAHLKFEKLAKNESVNFDVGKKLGFIDEGSHFMRKGTTKIMKLKAILHG